MDMLSKTTRRRGGKTTQWCFRGPGWPNMHGWAFIAFFVITMYILYMIQKNPALLAVPSFMQFAGQIVTGGILAAAAWLWTSNKATDKVKEHQGTQPGAIQNDDQANQD